MDKGYRRSLQSMNLARWVEASGTVDLFPMLAHEGGWDELLLVAGPLAIIGLLLVIANRRVDSKLRERADQSDAHSDS